MQHKHRSNHHRGETKHLWYFSRTTTIEPPILRCIDHSGNCIDRPYDTRQSLMHMDIRWNNQVRNTNLYGPYYIYVECASQKLIRQFGYPKQEQCWLDCVYDVTSIRSKQRSQTYDLHKCVQCHTFPHLDSAEYNNIRFGHFTAYYSDNCNLFPEYASGVRTWNRLRRNNDSRIIKRPGNR